MSFLDVASNNARGGGYSQMTERTESSPGQQAPEAKSLQGQVFQFTTSVTRFQKQVALLGTRRDTQQHRAKVNALGTSIKELAKEVSEQMKRAGAADPSKAKLVQDFQQVLKEFQKVYRTCLDKMANTMPNADGGDAGGRRGRKPRGGGAQGGPGLGGLDGGGGGLQDDAVGNAERMESQLLMDNQINHHDVLISEREEGIREIQGQIAEVGEIFQDLAVLVNEQGDMVNDIESNIVSSHGHTEQAQRELVKAASHQKSARNRMCMIMIIMIVVLVILVLVTQ
mmetsp:Transcript_33668/g.72821  ORF Transcript_33668/g.72821 Transcript_33668/m.72821 type:complete len:283 (+) Transcript_33668:254-1102(+)